MTNSTIENKTAARTTLLDLEEDVRASALRRAYIIQQLLDGTSVAQAMAACKEEHGTGMGNQRVYQLKAQIEAEIWDPDLDRNSIGLTEYEHEQIKGGGNFLELFEAFTGVTDGFGRMRVEGKGVSDTHLFDVALSYIDGDIGGFVQHLDKEGWTEFLTELTKVIVARTAPFNLLNSAWELASTSEKNLFVKGTLLTDTTRRGLLEAISYWVALQDDGDTEVRALQTSLDELVQVNPEAVSNGPDVSAVEEFVLDLSMADVDPDRAISQGAVLMSAGLRKSNRVGAYVDARTLDVRTEAIDNGWVPLNEQNATID